MDLWEIHFATHVTKVIFVFKKGVVQCEKEKNSGEAKSSIHKTSAVNSPHE